MLTTEQIGGIITTYRLECGALNDGRWYASFRRFPVFIDITLEGAIQKCVDFCNKQPKE